MKHDAERLVMITTQYGENYDDLCHSFCSHPWQRNISYTMLVEIQTSLCQTLFRTADIFGDHVAELMELGAERVNFWNDARGWLV